MFGAFKDRHSGGFLKEDPYEKIYIECDSHDHALQLFEEKFGYDPYDIACECCGHNYSVSSSESLDLLTAYERGCKWSKDIGNHDLGSATVGLEDYLCSPEVLVIYRKNNQ